MGATPDDNPFQTLGHPFTQVNMANSLSCKTAASRRLLLLASPDTVDPRDVDHLVVDTSAAHRSFMKERLYGYQRTERLKEGISWIIVLSVPCITNYLTVELDL